MSEMMSEVISKVISEIAPPNFRSGGLMKQSKVCLIDLPKLLKCAYYFT